MVDWLKTTPIPVLTSMTYPEYPSLVEFPLEDVLNDLGHAYLNNTGAYAVAYAVFMEVDQISLFGMDYTYANVHDAEKGRACVEFWLGVAHARGIKINLPQETSLMDACNTQEQRLYGYDTVDIAFNIQDDGYLKLDFKPREKLPTADEIEAAYDHSAPIAKQHMIPKAAA
jgi:hypothetical protein